MSKRSEPMIQVKDPKGEIFEVSRRNANDLVQNLGWSYISEVSEESLQADLATAPRNKQPRSSKVQAARELAAAKKTPDPETKVVGKKKKAKKADEEKAQAAKNKEGCESARRNLQLYQSGERIARRTDSGEREFLDEDQRAAEAAKAQKAVNEWCR